MGESSGGFRLEQIGQIAVPVTDVERAVAFYRDTFGMRLLFHAPPGLAFFDLNGVRLMLAFLRDTDGNLLALMSEVRA
jgi:catechol 2,3-dioxygenase-like lactoylglutathione lyase family enzyme